MDVDSILASTGINAEKNTWERKNNVVPNIIKNDNYIVIRTDEEDVYLTKFEETILEIILSFTFSPVWLVKQWLGENIISDETEDDTIVSWINSGLIWSQNSVTGEYLRPTYLLFKLFDRKQEAFTDIPYNQLTHTISEQEISFSVMSGSSKSPINKAFSNMYLPKFSPLGIEGNTNGTNIIREGEFRSVSLFMQKSIPEIEEIEFNIEQMISEGKEVTPEFDDFKNFVLVNKQNNTGELKKDYRFHIPDLIIPILRTEGKANSISIEVELTDKRLNRYIDTLEKYKDNKKFGSLVWLTPSKSINKNLREAFKQVGGLGDTKMYIYEFEIPSPSSIYAIKNY